jgi:hypothetical protein
MQNLINSLLVKLSRPRFVKNSLKSGSGMTVFTSFVLFPNIISSFLLRFRGTFRNFQSPTSEFFDPKLLDFWNANPLRNGAFSNVQSLANGLNTPKMFDNLFFCHCLSSTKNNEKFRPLNISCQHSSELFFV